MLFVRQYPDWCYSLWFTQYEETAGFSDKISMISQNKLDLLNDKEKDVLLYILNKISPPGFGIEVDLGIVKYYEVHLLKDIINRAKPLIKEENAPIIDSIFIKLFEDPSKIIS